MLGLAVAWLAVRAALVGQARTAPGSAAAVAPNDPAVVFRLATLRFAAQRNRLSEADYARVRRAAVAAPLSAEPFALLATRAIAKGDRVGAIRLLEEARRRNPRQRLARVLLLEQYLRTGRIREGSVELAVLTRLVPEQSPLLTDALAAMALDPQASAPLIAAMRGDPNLDQLLSQLVRKGGSTDLILRLGRTRRADPSTTERPGWQSELLSRMVQAGEYARARDVWAEFVGKAVPAGSLIVDPGFRRLDAPAPFNWQFAGETVGAVEPSSRGTLMVDYFGRESGPLARQLLLLGPGTYRLQVDVEGVTGAGGERGPRMGWTVRCAAKGAAPDSGRTILVMPLVNAKAGARRLAGSLTVPAGCPAQWLSLDGVAAEFPTPQSVELRNLSLQRSNAGTGTRT